MVPYDDEPELFVDGSKGTAASIVFTLLCLIAVFYQHKSARRRIVL
jgi:hypothetical protein